jgi:hypothetical protein
MQKSRTKRQIHYAFNRFSNCCRNVKLPDDAKIFITDTDAADGYPIAGFTWVLIYKEQNYNSRSATRLKNS